MKIVVTGGARSGKSSFAEQIAYYTANKGIYIATAEALDDEMSERIAKHQQQREQLNFKWSTIEEPLYVAQYLEQLTQAYHESGAMSSKEDRTISNPVILFDCLTLWLTNWLLKVEQEADREALLQHQIDKLLSAIQKCPYPIIIVTNEVGDGIVPTYPLGRWFRDEAGRLNQLAAELADKVFLVTAGIPIDIKAIAFRWEDL